MDTELLWTLDINPKQPKAWEQEKERAIQVGDLTKLPILDIMC